MDIYNQMVELLNEVEGDVQKYYDKGNKAAGTRIRKAMQSLKNRKKLMFNHTLSLETDKRKAGSTVYYVSSIKVNQDEVTFTKEDMDLMQKFQDIITTENEEIVALWKDSNRLKIRKDDTDTADTISAIDGSPFEAKTA